jgi:hypothetical protein
MGERTFTTTGSTQMPVESTRVWEVGHEKVLTADVRKKKEHHSCRNPTGSALLRDIMMTPLCVKHFTLSIHEETI